MFAQFDFSELNEKLVQYEASKDFNGVVLIAQKGKIIFSKCVGYADYNQGLKPDLNTPMHLASNSKAFTNYAIMILSERGLLNYEDKVAKYIPEFPYPNIEIRHLMTMTSGLKRLYNKDLDKDGFISTEDLLNFLIKKEPKLPFNPGDKVLSSVVSYCFLAKIISIVTGEDFVAFMDREIFQKLHMTETFIVTKENLNRYRAISYSQSYSEKEWFLGSYVGGVSIYATPADFLKWGESLYTTKLVSESTLNKSFEKFQLNDGTNAHVTLGGWMHWKGQPHLIFKNGDWVANNSILWRDVEEKITIIILNNRQNKITKHDLMEEILPVLGY